MTDLRRIVNAFVERLEAERNRMSEECTNKPCLHAQGIDLSISWILEEARRMEHSGRMVSYYAHGQDDPARSVTHAVAGVVLSS